MRRPLTKVRACSVCTMTASSELWPSETGSALRTGPVCAPMMSRMSGAMSSHWSRVVTRAGYLRTPEVPQTGFSGLRRHTLRLPVGNVVVVAAQTGLHLGEPIEVLDEHDLFLFPRTQVLCTYTRRSSARQRVQASRPHSCPEMGWR